MNSDIWKDLDKNLFTECCKQLKSDEFIYTDDFSPIYSRFAFEVGNPKFDAFPLFYNIQSDNMEIPNKNATIEEIIDIAGYFLDQQVKRLNGESSWSTILTSVYIHKSFHIENPILEFIFKTFSSATIELERYFSSCAFTNNLPFFETNQEIENIVNYYELKKLEHNFDKLYKVLPEELSDLYRFETGLIDLIKEPEKDFIFQNEDKIKLPETSKCLGFSPLLHLTKVFPKSKNLYSENSELHQTTLALVNDFVLDIKLIHNIISKLENRLKYHSNKENILMKLIKEISEWNQKSSHLLFTRYIFFSIFSRFNLPKLFEIDINVYGFTIGFIQTQSFKNASVIFHSAYLSLLSKLILPLPLCQKYLKKDAFITLYSFQENAYKLYNSGINGKICLKCQLNEHQDIVNKRFSFWLTSHSNYLFYLTLKNDFYLGLYGINDYSIVYYLLEFACLNCASSLDQLRTVRALVPFMKKSTKKTQQIPAIDIEDRTPEMSYILQLFKIEKHMFSALKYVFAFFRLKNAFGVQPNIDEAKLYACRTLREQTKLFQITIPSYMEYIMAISYSADILQQKIISIFNEAKRLINILIKKGSKKTEYKAIFQTLISASICVAGFSDGMKVKVTFPLNPVYPVFEFI